MANMYSRPNGEEVLELLPKETMKHGVYHVPGFPENNSKEAIKKYSERFKKGGQH